MPQFRLLFYAILQFWRPKGGPWHNAPLNPPLAVLKSLYCMILGQCHHSPLHTLLFMYITFSASQFKQVWSWDVDQML